MHFTATGLKQAGYELAPFLKSAVFFSAKIRPNCDLT